MTRSIAFLISIALCLWQPGPACAEGDPQALPEVTVSATVLRDTPLQQVPASVAVLDQDTLRAAGQQHLQDVIGLVANLNWSGDTNRPRYFQIRGIGELDQYQGAPNPSVGFLLDGIDFSGLGSAGTLYDVGQVEVIRGPQGMRYGANALAGLIAVQSAEPADEFGGRVDLEGGDYGMRSYGAVLTGPVAALDSSFRLAVQQYRGDGFYRNAYLGRDDTNGYDENTVRGKWRWQPADDLRAELTLLYVGINDAYDAWTLDGSRTTQTDQPGVDQQHSTGGALRVEYDGWRYAKLVLTGTAADSHIRYAYDGDFGNEALWAPYTYAYYETQQRDRTTHSLELRLESHEGGALNWLLGVYALDLSEHLIDNSPGLYADPDDPTQDSQTDGTTDSHFHSRNAAVFAELDGRFARRWRWSAGLRAERRGADYHDFSDDPLNPAPLTHDFAPVNHLWGGNASLEYALTAGQNAYVSIGRGYKAGGFNLGNGLPVDQLQFNPESDVNFELGWKADLDDHRLRLDSDVFYTHRSNLQLQTGEQTDPTNPDAFVLYNMNVPSGRNYGLESTLAFVPDDIVELGASAGLLNTTYHGLTFDGVPLPDRSLPHAPSWQASGSMTLHASHGAYLRFDVTGKGSFYYDLPALDPYASHAYVLLNIKAGIRHDHWSADVWVRNVTDRDYTVRGFYFADVPPDFASQQFTQLGEPRQFGASLSYSFGGVH